MLDSLHVKNIALIDETFVSFSDGLNILTGETGAGKSLVIGSISLALGARADKSIIREGAEYALVELVFSVEEALLEQLAAYEIFPEDGVIVLARRIMPGKSVSRINGEVVSGAVLKEVAGILLDLHAQHDNQILLKKQSHLEILDSYAGGESEALLKQCKSKHEECQSLRAELEETTKISENRDKELELARYEYDEIMQANLSIGEDETLEKAFMRMNNARVIAENVSNVANMLGGEQEVHVSMMLDRAQECMRQTVPLDETLCEVQDNLATAAELVTQSKRFLSRYLDGYEFSQEEYLQTEARLNEINRLKDKFGLYISDILQYAQDLETKIEKLEDVHAYEEKLAGKLEQCTKEQLAIAQQLSGIRQNAAKALGDKLKQALLDMNFLNVDLQIDVSPKPEKLGAKGFDDVEFMISLNPGEARKPLSSVASGGELSRIMLALKSVMASADEIPTLIFDEIDAGISGKTAWKVSEKLHVIATSHQVICITHLPQIAAMADTHYLIEKQSEAKGTTTDVKQLDSEEAVLELARLLGTDEPTEAVIQNARELRAQALQFKQTVS